MRATVVTLVLVLVAAAAAAGSGGPRVTLLQPSPVVVAGVGFAPGRAVAVGYVSGAHRARRIAHADAHGRVRAVFKALVFERCRGLTLRAGAAPRLVVLPCSAPGGKPVVAATVAGLVRGSAFVPGEHVVVSGRVSDTDPVTAKLDAAGDGTFAVHLVLPAHRCGELFVRATGSLGSAATFTFSGPDCKGP